MKNYMSRTNLLTHIRKVLRVSVSQMFFLKHTTTLTLTTTKPTLQLSNHLQPTHSPVTLDPRLANRPRRSLATRPKLRKLEMFGKMHMKTHHRNTI